MGTRAHLGWALAAILALGISFWGFRAVSLIQNAGIPLSGSASESDHRRLEEQDSIRRTPTWEEMRRDSAPPDF